MAELERLYHSVALVASILFVVFQALYQTRALQLLRGATAVAILGLVLLLLLPLNTFNWLLRGLLLAGANRPAATVPRRTAAGADQPGSARRPLGPLDR